jgi:hypothetical protein
MARILDASQEITGVNIREVGRVLTIPNEPYAQLGYYLSTIFGCLDPELERKLSQARGINLRDFPNAFRSDKTLEVKRVRGHYPRGPPTCVLTNLLFWAVGIRSSSV